MNYRLKLLILFQLLPAVMLGMTIAGYYMERFVPTAYWDGVQTRYETVPAAFYNQNLIDGVTFTAFFFFIGAAFSFVLLYFDKIDNDVLPE